ncbi:MAG: hypothetical protein II194_08445 [Bacteroidales bacterium]|nr:hypothetical protein [Bacteroidales bacterium]
MKKSIILSAMLLVFSSVMSAQTVISSQSLTEDGERVVVSFDVETDVKSIPANRKEIIMPFIYNAKDTLWLETLEVFGKGRFKREMQENHLAGDKDWALAENQVIKGDVYHYISSVPLKRWMKSTNLGIKRQMVGCNCEEELADQTLAEGVALFEEPLLPARRIPATFTLADATRQWDFGQDELEIIFKVSKIEIDSTVFNNEVTFGKILAAIDKIFANPKYKVDKIEIAGYASPEGRRSFNNRLAENRAKALINYIIENRPQYNLTAESFRLRNGEENWPGLRRLVLASNIAEKDQIVEIIGMDLPDEEKKLKLKAIDKGKVWKKMLNEVYPHLRCARYLAVFYDSTQDEAVDMINLANQMIREGNYAEAYETVKPYQDDLRAYNTVGTALMMQGKFEEALPWLQKAVESNTASAQDNIDLINAELEYEAQKKAEIEEYLKKFE